MYLTVIERLRLCICYADFTFLGFAVLDFCFSEFAFSAAAFSASAARFLSI
jgi:hypothetical protein